MTEERKFCRICKNLGIDCEAGTSYCSLSHRPDKLPNTLKCDEFILCDFIKRLEQENKELKKQHYEALKMVDKEIMNNGLRDVLKIIMKIVKLLRTTAQHWKK